MRRLRHVNRVIDESLFEHNTNEQQTHTSTRPTARAMPTPRRAAHPLREQSATKLICIVDSDTPKYWLCCFGEDDTNTRFPPNTVGAFFELRHEVVAVFNAAEITSRDQHRIELAEPAYWTNQTRTEFKETLTTCINDENMCNEMLVVLQTHTEEETQLSSGTFTEYRICFVPRTINMLGMQTFASSLLRAMAPQIEQQDQQHQAAHTNEPTRALTQTDLENRTKCVVCMERDREVVLLPCQHFACCRVCAAVIAMLEQQESKCPICRDNFEYMMMVYWP